MTDGWNGKSLWFCQSCKIMALEWTDSESEYNGQFSAKEKHVKGN